MATKSLAERIVDVETTLISTKDSLTEATVALEAAPDNEELLVQVEELTGQVETQTKTLNTLQNAEKALALKARPAGQSQGQGQAPAAPNYAPTLAMHSKLKPGGELIWKHAVADLVAFVERRPALEVIKARYADDERVAHTYMAAKMMFGHEKTAVAPASTLVPAWAGALVREDTRGFIESLTEVSVAAGLAAQSVSLDFDGAGSIKIPVENALPGTPTEPAWVGEGGVIPLTSFSFGSMTLNPYKLAAIATMTREIVQRSNPAIEQIINNSLRKAYARVLDQALLAPVAPAVANVRPASLLNGVAALAAGVGAPDANVRADIFTLVSALAAAGLGQKPVLLLNKLDVLSASMITNAMGDYVFRDEVASGRLMGIPFVASGHVPLHRVAITDAAYLATAFGALEFDVSDVATVTEANADGVAPTQADNGAGALGTAGQVPPTPGGIGVVGDAGAAAAGYTARSLWQTYSLGIRMIAQTSWGKMNAAAVQWIDGTDWS